METRAVWLIFGPLNDDQVNVVQIWVFNPLDQRSDLHLFRMNICTALSSHDGMCIIEQLLKFGPPHVGWVLTVAMQILNDVFVLEDL